MMFHMKLVSWNVNGMRAVLKRGDFDWFFTPSKARPDILCLQETKCRPEQLPPEIVAAPGYFSYFAWPSEKKGYSGVAIYSKVKPEKVEYGMGIESHDKEGRMITAYFKDFILVNCYFPNGGGGPERLAYKLEFYDHFLTYMEKLRQGDKNVREAK